MERLAHQRCQLTRCVKVKKRKMTELSLPCERTDTLPAPSLSPASCSRGGSACRSASAAGPASVLKIFISKSNEWNKTMKLLTYVVMDDVVAGGVDSTLADGLTHQKVVVTLGQSDHSVDNSS